MIGTFRFIFSDHAGILQRQSHSFFALLRNTLIMNYDEIIANILNRSNYSSCNILWWVLDFLDVKSILTFDQALCCNTDLLTNFESLINSYEILHFNRFLYSGRNLDMFYRWCITRYVYVAKFYYELREAFYYPHLLNDNIYICNKTIISKFIECNIYAISTINIRGCNNKILQLFIKHQKVLRVKKVVLEKFHNLHLQTLISLFTLTPCIKILTLREENDIQNQTLTLHKMNSLLTDVKWTSLLKLCLQPILFTSKIIKSVKKSCPNLIQLTFYNEHNLTDHISNLQNTTIPHSAILELMRPPSFQSLISFQCTQWPINTTDQFYILERVFDKNLTLQEVHIGIFPYTRIIPISGRLCNYINSYIPMNVYA